jgi:hypothetical protein
MKDFWMQLSAVSIQHSAKHLFFLVLADTRQLIADRAHRKAAVFGWALPIILIGSLYKQRDTESTFS